MVSLDAHHVPTVVEVGERSLAFLGLVLLRLGQFTRICQCEPPVQPSSASIEKKENEKFEFVETA